MAGEYTFADFFLFYLKTNTLDMDKLLCGAMKRERILACSKAFDWCSSDVEDNFIRKMQNKIF